MNVKQFVSEYAPRIASVQTPEAAGTLLAELFNTIGKDPRALNLTLAYIEQEIPFDDALGLWKVVGEMVPGVERQLGIRIRNNFWFEEIEWVIGTEVPHI